MKKVFIGLSLINIIIIALFAVYHVDSLNDYLNVSIDNKAIKDFVDNIFIKYTPDFIKIIHPLFVVKGHIVDIFGQYTRVVLFGWYTFVLILAIVSTITIVGPKKHYMSCIIRIAYSPVTAVLGFIINFYKFSNAYNNNYTYSNSTANNAVKEETQENEKEEIRRVDIKMPNKPVVSTAIYSIIILALTIGVVFLVYYLYNKFPLYGKFFGTFFGIFAVIMIISGISAMLYYFRTTYLGRCYKALKEGTSLEDAMPIFRYFEKYVNITKYEGNVVKVDIKIGGRLRGQDFEEKALYYKNGILVDKGEAYQRTSTIRY